MRFTRPRPLTLAQQYFNLRANPICAGIGYLTPSSLTWLYETQPNPLSRIYLARIEYHLGGTPTVFIDDPDLTLFAEGRKLPHVYQQRPTKLCLYLPRAFEWRACMRLDQTIVPWTALWLHYFEDWLWTGVWNGGGEHPAPAADRPPKNARLPGLYA